jgi:hypothetical protein
MSWASVGDDISITLYWPLSDRKFTALSSCGAWIPRCS